MVHGSLMACIKMGVSATNTKQQASVPFFGVIGHTQMLHMLVSVGSNALAAAVDLPRYGGLNYARGINEVLEEEKTSLCIKTKVNGPKKRKLGKEEILALTKHTWSYSDLRRAFKGKH